VEFLSADLVKEVEKKRKNLEKKLKDIQTLEKSLGSLEKNQLEKLQRKGELEAGLKHLLDNLHEVVIGITFLPPFRPPFLHSFPSFASHLRDFLSSFHDVLPSFLPFMMPFLSFFRPSVLPSFDNIHLSQPPRLPFVRNGAFAESAAATVTKLPRAPAPLRCQA
jgi:hypothetical protein